MTESQILLATPFILVTMAGLSKLFRWVYDKDLEKNKESIKEFISWTPLIALFLFSVYDFANNSQYFLVQIALYIIYIAYAQYRKIKHAYDYRVDTNKRIKKLEDQVKQLKTLIHKK